MLVAVDQVKGAPGFCCYPEDYEGLELVLVPEVDRTHPRYSGYWLVFREADIGDALEPLPPMDPRPTENRAPR